jgi:glutamine amidotransferase
MTHDLVLVDYGAGNMRSVVKAFAHLGFAPYVTSEPGDLAEARAVVLPGVGAAGQIMRSLRELGLDEAITTYIASGRPFLGVCMGMQVLMDWSDEDDGQACLGVIPGVVRRLDVQLKVPHMGWNAVRQRLTHPLWEGIPDQSYFYFVHSYVVAAPDGVEAGVTDYGRPFPSALARANVFGTQFHPEKSGSVGLRLYSNFVRWALGVQVTHLAEVGQSGGSS